MHTHTCLPTHSPETERLQEPSKATAPPQLSSALFPVKFVPLMLTGAVPAPLVHRGTETAAPLLPPSFPSKRLPMMSIPA